MEVRLLFNKYCTSINPQRMCGCINPTAQFTGELLTIVGRQ